MASDPVEFGAEKSERSKMQMDELVLIPCVANPRRPPKFSGVADGDTFTSHPLLSQVLVGEQLIISAVDLFWWPSVVGQQCFARMTL